MRALSFLLLLAVASCSRFGPIYPPRPTPAAGSPFADPGPSRVVAHLAIAAGALQTALDEAAPRSGDGTFPLLGSERRYTWERGSLSVGFSQGRVILATKVHAVVAFPLKSVELPLDLQIFGEPIVSSEYKVKLQSIEVHVTSTDARLAVAERLGSVYSRIEEPIATKLKDFAYDLGPLLSEVFGRVSRPIALPLGDASACGRLRVIGVEAGPTVLADGIEKDLAIVVVPSITMPCPPDETFSPGQLPPLSNVAALASGPFTVTIPVAARYDELTRAMTLAFSDGKLFISSEYPEVFLEKPEVYEAQGQLVLKVHIAGPVHSLGIDTDLDGDLYLVGHPAIVDNELRVPDLEPTIETRNFLLTLKAMTSGDRIRDQARAALRLDIGERIDQARAKLGSGLTFGNESGCFRADVDHVEVTGVFAHASYLRLYVAVTAHARATMPCSGGGTTM